MCNSLRIWGVGHIRCIVDVMSEIRIRTWGKSKSLAIPNRLVIMRSDFLGFCWKIVALKFDCVAVLSQEVVAARLDVVIAQLD